MRRRALLAFSLVLLAMGVTLVWVRNRVPPEPGPSPPVRLSRIGDAAPSKDAPSPARGEFHIAGRIVDGLGQGIAEVRIVATREEGTDKAQATSLVDGQFKVEGLPRGAYRVHVESEEVLPAELRFVAAPGVAMTVVVLRRVRLAGVVIDDGRPAGGATVAIGGQSLVSSREVLTSADGRFVFDDLPEGIYTLAATKGARAALWPEVSRFGMGPWEDVSVALADAALVEGSVVDEAQGEGIPGAQVLFVPEAEGGVPRRATTDERGAFTLPSVAMGSWSVEVEAMGFLSPFPQAIVIGSAAALRLDLHVGRGGTILGQVVDASGVPIPGARVEAHGVDTASRLAASSRARGRWGDASLGQGGPSRLLPIGELGVLKGPIPYPPPPGAVIPKVVGLSRTPRHEAALPTTDAEGQFRLDALPAGSYVVSAVHLDFARGESPRLKLALRGEVEHLRLVLARGATVEGDITDVAGAPLRYAEVRVVTGGETTLYAHADESGRFRLPHQTGSMELRVTARGFASAARALVVGEGQEGKVVRADFRLARAGGTIAGEVVDPGHRPMAGVTVTVTSQTGSSRAVTDEQGRFSILGLEGGTYRLEATHADFPALPMASVETGTDPLRLLLAYGGGIFGEVRDAQTRLPIAEITLVAKGPHGAPLERRFHGGTFELTALAAGPWTLLASAPGYAPLSLQTEVPPGRRPGAITVRDLRLDLVQGADAAGIVLDVHGERLAAARVSCGDVNTTSDAKGRFRLRGCAPGEVTIGATHPRAGSGARTIPLRSGDDLRTLEIRLDKAH